VYAPAGAAVTAPTRADGPRAPAILSVTDVVKRFGDGDDSLLAVDHVSFDIAEGEFVSIIGPSGCGKSTLFNIIGGLVAEYEGRVAVAGEAVSGTHPAFGMVFQDESAFPWRTVIDNVAFPLELAGVSKRERARDGNALAHAAG
jgi:NitT/TauT family transport system ATP-binding protein